MFGAVFIGWLCGKVIAGLVRGVIRFVEGVAYLFGAAGGLVVGRLRSGSLRQVP